MSFIENKQGNKKKFQKVHEKEKRNKVLSCYYKIKKNNEMAKKNTEDFFGEKKRKEIGRNVKTFLISGCA